MDMKTYNGHGHERHTTDMDLKGNFIIIRVSVDRTCSFPHDKWNKLVDRNWQFCIDKLFPHIFNLLFRPAHKLVCNHQAKQVIGFKLRHIFATNKCTQAAVCLWTYQKLSCGIHNLQIHTPKYIHKLRQIGTVIHVKVLKNTLIRCVCLAPTDFCFLLAITQMICARVVNLMSFGRSSSISCHLDNRHQFYVIGCLMSNDPKKTTLTRRW